MQSIQNSWALAKTSWRVLADDKELLWLPVISFVCWLAVAALFVGPILLGSRTTAADGSTTLQMGPLGWVLAFVGYVALAYVGIFFRTAILCAARERLDGGDPTVGSALRAASRHAGRILPWAILATTVSLVLRAIEERAGVVGRLVVMFVGVAWSLVTFLVLPVLVVEDVGVVDAVKRSATLFKGTWGENVSAQVGFSLLGFVAVLVALPVLFLLAATGVAALVVVGIVLLTLWMAAVAVVISALGGIFQMALYRFAAEGRAPDAFADADLRSAFRPRRRTGLF